MNDTALLNMIGPGFARMFESIAPPIDPKFDAMLDRMAEQRIKREDFVAGRAPELAKQYAADPKRWATALADIDYQKSPAILRAYVENDDGEAARLTRAAAVRNIADMAADDAEDEAWALFGDAP